MLHPILSSWSSPRKRNQLLDQFHAFFLGFWLAGCVTLECMESSEGGRVEEGQVVHPTFLLKNMRFLSLKHFKLLPISSP